MSRLTWSLSWAISFISWFLLASISSCKLKRAWITWSGTIGYMHQLDILLNQSHLNMRTNHQLDQVGCWCCCRGWPPSGLCCCYSIGHASILYVAKQAVRICVKTLGKGKPRGQHGTMKASRWRRPIVACINWEGQPKPDTFRGCLTTAR